MNITNREPFGALYLMTHRAVRNGKSRVGKIKRKHRKWPLYRLKGERQPAEKGARQSWPRELGTGIGETRDQFGRARRPVAAAYVMP
jgi:hypothetical protein